MRKQFSNKPLSIIFGRSARSACAFLLMSGMVFVPGAPANATTTYAVPTAGLSFDANDTVQSNPCPRGFCNASTLSYKLSHEVNGLVAGEFLTYENVANIGGQAIDAKVTLTTIAGMRSDRSAIVLDRLDKCDIDSKSPLIEINFDSATAIPGEASFVLTIDFLLGGTSNAATLTNLKMNVEDIDNNQYLEVDNFTSRRLADGRGASDVQEYRNNDTINVGAGANNPVLSALASARRFHAEGSSSGSDGSTETDKHVVEVTYASVSSLVLELGVYEAGGGSFDLNFRGFEFVSDTVTPAPSSPAPAASLAATPRLATTGTSETIALGFLASMSSLLVVSGAFLLHRRRKLG